jgi:type I restriction enzyme S subunit
MISDLKPHAVMRDSGGVWLGEVPKGWDVLRGRQLFEIKKRISGELGHPVISVTQEGLRVKDVESGEGQLSQDYSKYQTVGVGEFAMNSMDLLTGGVGIATSIGVTSPDYRVFAIRDESRCCDRYMLHVLRMLYRNRGFYAWGQGSAQLGRWRLPRKRFNDFPFPVPPFTEQAAIARFLDWANGRLERAIRAKRKVIALLNEQKQAIIHRAVTRGLDPSVPLKPSGIPWLGDIPLHWEVRQARHVGRLLKGTGGTKEDAVEAGVPCVRYGELYTSYKNFIRGPRTFVNPARAVGYTPIRYGDVLFAASGEKIDEIGKSAVNLMKDAAVCGGDIVILRPTVPTHAPFLGYALDSYQAARQKATMCRGTTIKHIYPDELRGLQACFPPINEQEKIATSLDAELLQLNRAISRLEREIELLREYRTRLVADVVTGKLDVREAAARLPDEAAPDIVEDDTDPSLDPEAANEEAAV